MIELPEAVNLAKQLNATVSGKRIAGVTAAHTPHKLAWYYGEPGEFAGLLVGREVGPAGNYAGLVEIKVENTDILLGEDSWVRFHTESDSRPPKHQLLVEFEDGSALSVAMKMYGGVGAFPEGKLENEYYQVAREKPSPLSAEFDDAYFDRIISADDVQKLSMKALLATEQRIPGLGNGVLQDILFNAKLHPKKKVSTLSGDEKNAVFNSVKTTLAAMTERGGRDTEADLFGRPGGYPTILSKNTLNRPCPVCGGAIRKEAYMGGAVYFCENCQVL
jgi:formamidopyrimidine-DNA glycosylase